MQYKDMVSIRKPYQSIWIIYTAPEMKYHCFNVVIMELEFMTVEAQMEQVYFAIMVN